MSDELSIPDRSARVSAETTFDRNVIVVAGAGTGKTTLLVNRLVHLLMKEPNPVSMTQIVALTFTNKAATDIKVRLRDRLTALSCPESNGLRSIDGGVVSLGDLREQYGLSADAVAMRARAALQDLEKAQLGTLHSFAAHLVRLYPLESTVGPDFKEDDGLRFEEHFTAAWDCWLDQELGRHGQHHWMWRKLLASTKIDAVRNLTRSLCSELVDLERVEHQIESTIASPALVQWLQQVADQAQQLLVKYDRPKRRNVERMLAAAASLLRGVAQQGSAGRQQCSAEDLELLGKDLRDEVAGWDKGEFKEAKKLIKIALHTQRVDHEFLRHLLRLLTPLVQTIRVTFAQQGWLSFDGLLARARALLFEHSSVRERIKRDYRAVLVDEFQDTDPVQYEIILAVSEREGSHANRWSEMALEPGKLFIVGDPKQSIYAFRRADIEAFDRVVEKVAADGGMVQTLRTNFRSHAMVLGPINDVFDRLFERQPLVQPANVRLEVHPRQRSDVLERGVRLTLATPAGEGEVFDSAGATRAESEMLARWLKEEVLSLPSAKPGHVALLFRKLTQADAYLDALRRNQIPYVIEGEKHFYRRQEVIDLVNLLRVLDHPHDSIALTGLLRSPLGGLTDRDLYDLRQSGYFNYLYAGQLDGWPHPRAAAVRRLYGYLAHLHRRITALPLTEAIEVIFDCLPILELAAASLHGEQAVANLLKVKQTAAALADRPHLTLSRFVDLMVQRLEEQPDESESPLAEESLGAVQVLTIHKAKGLEFPIVVLPGLHQGSGRDRAAPQVSYDWSSETYGLSLGNQQSLGALLVQHKLWAREEAERRRVLYVGMTRAKEMLLLSGGVTARSVGETVLEQLQRISTGNIGTASTDALKVGNSVIPHRVVTAPERKWAHRRRSGATAISMIDLQEVSKLWQIRTARWEEVLSTAYHMTPTGLAMPKVLILDGATQRRQDPVISQLVGLVAHRLLERWDFAQDPSGLLSQVERAIQTNLMPERHSHAAVVAEALNDLLAGFGRSETYARLRSATILGREVPFVMPWGDQQIMEGVIDLIYRLDGTLWIADYKTDQVTCDQAVNHAEQYRTQSVVYKAAVKRSLEIEEVHFHCLFLRCGTAVEL